VRLVAAEAGLSAVHRHRRECSLLLRVATLAIRGLVGLHTQRAGPCAAVDRNARRFLPQGFFVARALERERVAGGANCFAASPEAFHRLGFGVANVAFFLVAGCAAIRRHRTHLLFRRGVTLHAFDLLTDDVNAMTGHVARKAPRFVDVHAGPPLPVQRRCFLRFPRRVRLVGATDERRKHEYRYQYPCKQRWPLFHSRPS